MNFIIDESVQKLRGGYYTNPAIARFLSRWVLEGRPETVLEPSCGDGVFFDALQQPRLRGPKSVMAFEIDPTEASKARLRGRRHPSMSLEVFAEDFLGWALGRLGQSPMFDAVVGNPPFIRYQYLNPLLQAQSERIFRRFDLPFTKHTNAWVPFVLASVALLRPGGRLAMVVPAELLHVLHAESLRRFLLERCSRVLLVDPEELIFEGTLQGVVLLLAERSSGTESAKGRLAVSTLGRKAFLDESASTLFEKADFVAGTALGAKWMLALLSASERSLLLEVAQRPQVCRFAEIASVDVGIVTGANSFFLVTDEVVKKYNLERWAHPMFGRSSHVQGVVYDKRNHDENRVLGFPSNFLWFPIDDTELGAGARRYLKQGEADRLNTRYKCRIRTPWYRVPSVHTAPVGMLKRSHHFPRLVLNRARALTTDTSYRVRPRGVQAGALVACFVNSLTALTAELEGRHYGGGVLELVPSEIERLLVPSPHLVANSLLGALDVRVRQGLAASELLVEQDRNVLRALGLRQADCMTLLGAWSHLRNRRQRVSGDASDLEDDARVAS